MFDKRCNDIRNVIHDALDDEVASEDSELMDNVKSGLSMWFTDNGLAVMIDDAIYHVAIERV